MNKVKDEPVVVWVSVGTIVSALLYQFVPDISNELVNAIVNSIVTLGPIVFGMIYARSKVKPLSKIERGE